MILLIFVVALVYAFWNGLHDAPAILAQVTATRSVGPRTALVITGVMELAGALFFSQMVLKTMSFAGEGLVWASPVEPGLIRSFVLSALIVALVFNMGTWYLGFPSSSTHALFGAMTGAALALHLGGNLMALKLLQMLAVLMASAAIGGVLGFVVTRGLGQLDISYRAGHALLAPLNAVLSGGLAFLHGANDMPKSLGLFLLALRLGPLTHWPALPEKVYLILFSVAISFGIMFGENRIFKLLGMRIFRLRILQGLGAGMVSSASLGLCTALGFPVSSTQILVGSMLGAGAAKSAKAIRWMVVWEILLSWVITLPACAALGYLMARFLAFF
ncbi:MAG: inorganic phosphate transporter [Elusimicrobiota bacterium]